MVDEHRTVKKAFNSVIEKRNTKWYRAVAETLASVGLEQCLYQPFTCDLKYCKTELLKLHNADWQRLLKTKPKLRTFVQIKNHYACEKYVMINLERNQRSVLAQLRFSILPLKLETGRFTGTKPEERFCDICNSEAVEDECHFLFHCPCYDQERVYFYSQLTDYPNFRNLSDIQKLKMLFILEPRKLAKFACKALQKRQDMLYNVPSLLPTKRHNLR